MGDFVTDTFNKLSVESKKPIDLTIGTMDTEKAVSETDPLALDADALFKSVQMQKAADGAAQGLSVEVDVKARNGRSKVLVDSPVQAVYLAEQRKGWSHQRGRHRHQ